MAGDRNRHVTGRPTGAARLAVLALIMLLASGGILIGQASPAAASGTLSLYKAVENLDTGSGFGDRGAWDVQAVNTSTGETFRHNGLNGFQARQIPAGTYRISELPNSATPSGYRFREWNCGGTVYTDPEPVITLADGQGLTCTVVNEAVHSTLTLHKDVEGGSADPALWTLRTLDGPVSFAGPANSAAVTDQRVRPGTYRLLEEGGPAAYEQGEWVCTYEDGGDGGGGGTLPVSAGGQVTIGLGQQVTCSITNTADITQLTLVKQIAGTAAPVHAPEDFTLSASSPAQEVSGPSGSVEVSHVEVQPDTGYVLSEEGPAGYDSQGWSCAAAEGSYSLADDVVSLSDGADVTCTVTNEFAGGWLTLEKEVENSTRPATDWTLSASGTGEASGTGLEGATGADAVTRVPVPPGDYELAEEGPEGYLTPGFICDGDSPGYSVTVEPGDDITCTITNSRDQAITQLTLAKEVDNGRGGPLPATAWGLRAVHEDGPVYAGRTGLSPVTYRIVEPGTLTLGEEALPEHGSAEEFGMYEAGDWRCTDTFGNSLPVGEDLEVEIPEGAQVRCVVENTWTGSTITFGKQVADSVYGTHGPAEWTLAVQPAEGGEPVVTGDGEDGIREEPLPAGEYRLVELDGPEGYEFDGFSCEGAAVDPEEGTLTVEASTAVECTVTNRAVPPTLTLIKEIQGGEAAVGDFTLLARGPADAAISGASGTASVTGVELPAGEYAFSEYGPAGYFASWSCEGGRSWDEASQRAVMDAGDTMVCTALNTYDTTTLTLAKIVRGGDSTRDDWVLSASGAEAAISGRMGDEGVTGATVPAGTYDLSEAPVVGAPTEGYLEGTWNCLGSGTLEGATVTLEDGDDMFCTVTNTYDAEDPEDLPATLTLAKIVEGGPAARTDWVLSATGADGAISGRMGEEEVTGAVMAPGTYELSEAAAEGVSPEGYADGEWVCLGSGTFGGGTVSLDEGDEMFCTVTNVYEEPGPSEPEPSPTDPEPSPTGPEPTEPEPTEPGPTTPTGPDPSPTDPSPTGPGPTGPDPTVPSPTEPGPTQPEPTQPEPSDPAPTEQPPTDPTPTESAGPTDPSTTDPTPTDPAPTDPGSTESADPSSPAPTPPAPSPTEPEPTDPEPTTPTEPTPPEPTGPGSADPSPTAPGPDESQPPGPEPTGPSPTGAEPTIAEPTGPVPTVPEPGVSEPGISEPGVPEPTSPEAGQPGGVTSPGASAPGLGWPPGTRGPEGRASPEGQSPDPGADGAAEDEPSEGMASTGAAVGGVLGPALLVLCAGVALWAGARSASRR